MGYCKGYQSIGGKRREGDNTEKDETDGSNSKETGGFFNEFVGQKIAKWVFKDREGEIINLGHLSISFVCPHPICFSDSCIWLSPYNNQDRPRNGFRR